MIKDRNIYVMDVEQFSNIHTSVWKNIDTKEIKRFVIHKLRDNRLDYFKFLRSVKKIITYNGLHYDYKIIHKLLDSEYRFSRIPINDVLREMTLFSNNLIRNKEYNYRINEYYMEVVDLFKIWHYDNSARRTSLKHLQCSMNYHNVEDFEDFNKIIQTEEEIEEVLKYNENDVLATDEFLQYSYDKIRLRQMLRKEFGLNCVNYSDSLLGEKLILHFYYLATGIRENDLKSKQANYRYPAVIRTKDCIFDYVKFDSFPYFNFCDKLKKSTISAFGKLKLNVDAFRGQEHNNIKIEEKGKKDKKESVVFVTPTGLKCYIGAGGIHSSRQGSFYSTKKKLIIDIDVSSLYPNIALGNDLYPCLLGKQFINIYKEKIVNVRLASKTLIGQHKKGKINLTKDELVYHSVISDGYKLAANSVYGKSNDENSVLRDPLYTCKTTINGQLFILMFVEKIERIAYIIQANTDGVTVMIDEDKLNEFYQIKDDWQKLTQLELEEERYKEFHIRDVNNYLALKEDGTVKAKGAYEFDKKIGNEPAFHKDNSFRIVPLLTTEYFKNPDINILERLKKHDNIYDFLGRQRFNEGDWGELYDFEQVEEDEYGNLFGEQIKGQKQPKTLRLYVSSKGKQLYKFTQEGKRKNRVYKGYKVKQCNVVNSLNPLDYDIDYDFYNNEIHKLINSI